MTASALLAKGNLKLQINTAITGAATYADIPGVKTIGGGGNTTDRLDITSFSTPGNSKEYMAGLGDPQGLTFDLNYIPGDAIQQQLRTANLTGSTVQIRCLLAMSDVINAEHYDFDGMVTKFSAPVGNPDKELMISAEIMPYVQPTYATGVGA